MAKDFVITAEHNPEVFRTVEMKDGADTYSLDFAPWAEDNNTVTGATWTVEAGQASISGEALASNVASALISFPQEGRSLIKIDAETGTESYVVFIRVMAKDPKTQHDDYGLII